MRRPAQLVAILSLASACSFVPRERPPVDPSGQIEAAVASFFAAYEAGQVDSVVSFFTADALLMPPGAPTVRGTDDLTEHVAAGMALGRWIQETETDTLIDLGDHVVQVGTWAIRFEPDESTPPGLEPFEDAGRLMIHWQRSGGRWRIAQYLANRAGA